jgi:hypothetical protein
MTVAARRPRPSPVLGVQEYASGGLGPASLGGSVLGLALVADWRRPSWREDLWEL